MNRPLFLLLAVCVALLPNCSTPKPQAVARGTVSVKVVPNFGKNVPVKISVFAPKNGKHGPELYSYLVGDDGITGFVLPMDQEYEIRAFADIDRSGKQGPNDPAGILEGVKPNPDVTVAQAPLVLTLSAPSGAGVPAEAPDKKKEKVPAAPGPAAATAAPKQGAEKPGGTGAGVPVPPPPVSR